MFVQVIQGHVSDPDEVKAALDGWVNDQASDAIGWLGTTAGVTDDGTLIIVARFESAEDAQSNSDRPEQTDWWEKTSQLFTDEPTFADSSDISLVQSGGSDDAGFVQVIQGRSSDPTRAKELMESGSRERQEFRPDMIGGVVIQHGSDGRYTFVVYFTSESEARANESKAMPEELKAQFEEVRAFEAEPRVYLDLHVPWIYSNKQKDASY